MRRTWNHIEFADALQRARENYEEVIPLGETVHGDAGRDDANGPDHWVECCWNDGLRNIAPDGHACSLGPVQRSLGRRAVRAEFRVRTIP